MAVANGTAAPGGISTPAASSDSSSQGSMVPQMIGPSTNQCYVRPLKYNMLPQGYGTTPTQGACGYGYYNQCNQHLGTYGMYHMPNNSMGMTGASHAAAGCCGNLCFSALATTPVNSCGMDQGGVPLTIAALERYNSPATDQANTLGAWQNQIHSCALSQQIGQWAGLQGATRGLCLMGPMNQHGGLTVCGGYGGGGLNSGWGNTMYYPSGCIVTFMHELQEIYNPNCSNQDASDVRYNTPGTPAHCNNFKSCGVGYQCFDSAFTNFWGTDYGNSPNAWCEAKTSSYNGGNLLAPGGGPGGPGPGTPGPAGPPGSPGPITVNLPGQAPIQQVAAAQSCGAPIGGRHRVLKPQQICAYMPNHAHGGFIYGQNMANGGTVKRHATFAAPAAPGPAGPPGPTGQPVTVNVVPPAQPAPQTPNINPFVSVSPAYPYRGITCANKISYPGFESWNYPLGSPETPGGPGIPTPPGCKPPGCAPGTGGSKQIIPITNIPGITGIQLCGNNVVYIGQNGKPLCAPTPTGTGSHGSHACNPCGPCQPSCTPCTPAPGPCAPKPCAPAPAPTCNPWGKVSPFMPCYMGQSPWPSPQNVWGGNLPQTPWLPGGKVDNGLGPSPAAPASPIYGPAPANNAAFQGPNIPAPVMPTASPSTQVTTTGLCTQHPSFCQWDQGMEDPGMLANNWSQGGNCAWGFLANLQNGNVQFPSVTNTTGNPGVAPVTPGQCGNLYAYPGSDKWQGTNPNPYIQSTNTPGGPGCTGGGCTPSCGDGDSDWDDQGGQNQALGQQHQSWQSGGMFCHGGAPTPTCLMSGQNTQFTGGACFGGNQWGNTGNWGGWGSTSAEPQEDSAESWAQHNWCNMWAQDIAKQQGQHPGTSTGTSTGAIPCWAPPNWNNGNNPAFGNTSSPVGQGQFPTWPGQAPGTGAPAQGGYTAQATPFQNGDLYQPGFENVGAGFQGNPWQPACLSQTNPGAISMGLAGFQLPQSTGTTPSTGATGSQPGQQHAHGGPIVPGHAEFDGDTEKNDKVKAMLSPGEIVIPRSIALDAQAPAKAAAFVAAVLARKSPSQALRRAHG